MEQHEYRVRGANRYQQWLDDNAEASPSVRKRVELRGMGIDPYSPEGREQWVWLKDLELADPGSFPKPPTYEQWLKANV